jgi:hypothetical protein
MLYQILRFNRNVEGNLKHGMPKSAGQIKKKTQAPSIKSPWPFDAMIDFSKKHHNLGWLNA